MWDSNQPVKVRIAPSPTGEPHVGTAYIGLFNLAFARRHEGRFILRIEDTDQERSTKESEHSIFESLGWLGLVPDEGPEQGGPVGPYRQSERTELYRQHAEILLQRGTAYRCFCTKERLDELRERQKAEGKQLGYDGHCRTLDEAAVVAHLQAGTPWVVRLKMPTEGETVIRDLLRGDVRYQNGLVDDQILLKSDGFPTYHLANVVDDHLMGVTHVMRAEEWIPSTPKHVTLYEAFGWLPPTWIHMPLLRNPDKGKSKISKRKNPVSLLYYKRRGFLPEALLNYLALMGWSFPGEGDREIFSLDEFLASFDVGRVSLGGPVFDLAKLEWMNGQYVRALSPDELTDRLCRHHADDAVWTEDTIRRLVPLLQERMTVLSELDYLAQFHHGTILLQALADRLTDRAAVTALRDGFQNVRQKLENAAPYWNLAELQAATAGFGDDERSLAGLLFDETAPEPLGEVLFFRGKTFAVKVFQEAVDTLKKLVPKKHTGAEVAAALRGVAAALADMDTFGHEAIEQRLKAFADEQRWQIGDLFMPVRIACFGRAASPGLFETMVVVGSERCRQRLTAAAAIYERL